MTGSNLPEEILLRIIHFLVLSDRTNRQKTDHSHVRTGNIVYLSHNCRQLLTSCSKVNRQWNRVFSPFIWRLVALDSSTVRPFVRSLLSSVCGELRHQSINGKDFQLLDDIEARVQRLNESEASVDSVEQIDAITPVLQTADLNVVEILDSDDSDDDENVVFGLVRHRHVATSQDADELEVLRVAGFSNPLDFGNKRLCAQAEFKRQGMGVFVQAISLPSCCPDLHLFGLIVDLLPNWKYVSFVHPPHGPEFIPTLQPSLIKALRPLMHNWESLTIEDVDEDGWIPLMASLACCAPRLRHLNIEAIPEKDPYQSIANMSAVFQHLPFLECLRLDGVPIGCAGPSSFGGDQQIKYLSQISLNIRAVTLDYCDISMNALFSLWNNCANLEFLGMAGLNSDPAMLPSLNMQPKLKTMRFVDCDVNDMVMQQLFLRAPALEMLRIVFEDSDSLQIFDLTENLSDEFLMAAARNLKHLKILAISKSRRMTVTGFKAVLESTSLRILDFHRTESTPIGALSDEFFVELMPSLKNIKVLNLHGHESITCQTMQDFWRLGYANNLQSLCLNKLHLDNTFLQQLVAVSTSEPNTSLQKLSVFGCGSISFDGIQENILNNQPALFPALKTVYTETLPHDSASPPFVETYDSWFMDEELDILSMWSRAVQKTLSNDFGC